MTDKILFKCCIWETKETSEIRSSSSNLSLYKLPLDWNEAISSSSLIKEIFISFIKYFETKHCEWFYIEYKANPIGCNRRCDAHANTNEYFGMNGKKKVVA
ncbi:hypothetical protein Avbf_06644 [Armadillidium vulgare]|nr:hypothetical protein Avbf_06644 [Armadillidium vulgare]